MRRKLIDLTGMTFGLLNVMGKAPAQGSHMMWRVRCVCGNEKDIRSETLRAGKAKSCGCAASRIKSTKMEKKFSLVNQRFGRLWVLWRAESKKYSRSIMWECRCDCGQQTIVSGNALRKGHTKSCGCLLKELWLPVGQAARNVTLARYKEAATKRGLLWALSDSEFDALVKGDCHYCGARPMQVTKVKNCRGEFVYNGIDRRNNELGYTAANSVSCCFTCNSMKRTMTPDAFFAHLLKIFQHMSLCNQAGNAA